MADKDRKADVFAKPETFLDKLKRRRQKYEEGDPEGGAREMQNGSKKKKKDKNQKGY